MKRSHSERKLKVEVRFIGASRVIARVSVAQLDLQGEPTLKDALVIINEKYLKRKLLDKNEKIGFPCIIAVNGKMMRDRAVDLFQRLGEGDVISLFPPPAGG
jgi:molybdopterin converting factor small subunit